MPETQATGQRDKAAVARMLCGVRALTGKLPEPAGVLWKLAESGRQLDANLVRLPAGEHIGTHAEPDLDVLVLVVTGDGVMDTPEGVLPLAEGVLLWLPHGSTRSITAGPQGLAYVTVHRRRPGMQIRRRADLTPVTAQPDSP
ncbi:cupin domain-containing protein [Streptomyces sp. Li-HN-5-11]|uniref:cupin domain-containing protein n=1 Tax=Streptomyces sp. Li-HN-5-11 TaxID=3075432 RepID=UPI0037D9D4E7